jgi:hypothetical protein
MVRSVRRTRLEHRKSAIADLRTNSADLRVNPGSVGRCPSPDQVRGRLFETLAALAPQDEVEVVARSQCQTANAPPARVLLRRRVRLSFYPSKSEGAERRPAHQQNSRRACQPACIVGRMRSGVGIPARDAAPSGAPLRRFWASGPYFRARMGRSPDYGPLRPTCLGGFRRPSPYRVQPLKAAPHSWSGRLPLPPGA